MFDRTGKYLIFAILLGMVLGVLFVAVFGEAGLYVKFLGDIFLKLLKMLVIPLLFCSMVVGITNLGDVRKLGRTGFKTILYFLATSTIAVIIGLVLVNIIRPGVGASLDQAIAPDAIIGSEGYSFLTWLTAQIPDNIFFAAAETQVLPIIVVALFFGGVLSTIGSKGRPVVAIFEGLNQVLMKAVHIIMWFAPIGIFGLVAGQLAAVGGIGQFTTILTKLGWYSLVVILGLLIHGAIILPLILKFIAGRPIFEYFSGMSQALVTAFATASSSATLPVTMECVEEKNDVDKRASSFVLPLGATINMDGTALYEAVAALFIAQAYGISMPILAQVTICVTAVLASIGAAGIPQAGLITMVLVLQAVGLPLEGIGMILAIDWFLDRCRTTVNVWGDAIGAAVIGTTAEIGLVDRRRSRVKQSDQDSRGRGDNRRDNRRDNNRRRQQRPDPRSKDRDSGSFQDKRKEQSSGPQKRQKDRSKRQDRNAANRTVRKIHKVEVVTENQDSELYRPDGRKTGDEQSAPNKQVVASGRPNGNVKPDEKPDSNKASDTTAKGSFQSKDSGSKQSNDKSQPKSETTFGRKRGRGNRLKKQDSPAKESPEKPEVKDGTSSLTAKSKTETDYEVPKFPKGILNDLATPAKPVIAAAVGINESPESSTDTVKPEPVEAFGAETNAPNDPSTEGSVTFSNTSQDFSKLDKVIFGERALDEARNKAFDSILEKETVVDTTEATADAVEESDRHDNRESETKVEPVLQADTNVETKPEFEHDKSQEKDDAPFASQTSPTEDEPAIQIDVPEPETKQEAPEVEPVESSEEVSVPDTTDDATEPKAKESLSGEMDSETDTGEDDAENASVLANNNEQTEDSDDSPEWGRTKRRKPAR
ncbi:MAG: cation:dicarboxylase symporter family transporter [Candidatus Zixiibacteriota bacterium]